VIRQSIIAKQEGSRRLEACDIHGFLNVENIILVENDVTFTVDLINKNGLQVVTKDHPIFGRLENCVREDWPEIEPSRWEFYASPEYGYKHLEGQDLIFITTILTGRLESCTTSEYYNRLDKTKQNGPPKSAIRCFFEIRYTLADIGDRRHYEVLSLASDGRHYFWIFFFGLHGMSSR